MTPLALRLASLLPPPWRVRESSQGVLLVGPGRRWRVRGRMLEELGRVGESWAPVGFSSPRRLGDDVAGWVVGRVWGEGQGEMFGGGA